MHSQNLINIISDELPNLNKSESKVARVILADPDSGDSIEHCYIGQGRRGQ